MVYRHTPFNHKVYIDIARTVYRHSLWTQELSVAQPIRAPLCEESAVRIELLDAVVSNIGHIYIA